jgi:hypothetical protein
MFRDAGSQAISSFCYKMVNGYSHPLVWIRIAIALLPERSAGMPLQ